MIAHDTLTSPVDRDLLDRLRLDDLRRRRPTELEARRRLAAELAPATEALAADAADAREEAAARKQLAAARAALEQAMARVDAVTRRRRGRSHADDQRAGATERRLRELAFPGIERTVAALLAADYAACAIHPQIVSVDHEATPIEPEERQWWVQLGDFVKRRQVVKMTTPGLAAFVEQIRDAQRSADALALSALDDEAVLARLRAMVDSVLRTPAPLSAGHVLVDLTDKLDGDPLDVWCDLARADQERVVVVEGRR